MPKARANYSFYIRALGLGCILSSPLWVHSLFFAGDYEYAASLALVPLWLVINLAGVIRVSRRDPFLRSNLPIALLVKIAAAGFYLFMLFHVYGGGDAVLYFDRGRALAEEFSARGQFVVLDPFWSTNFIYMVTSALIIVFGKALPFFVVLFATISFWGEYLAYRAFCIAFPHGDRELSVGLIFFMPSIVFWSATLGKDAVILFFIALSCYGFALVLHRPGPRSYGALALGVLGVMIVRPHMAAMIGLALTVPYAFIRSRGGVKGLLAKLVSVPLLVFGTYHLVTAAGDFLVIENPSNTMAVIQRISNNGFQGGSAFGGGESLSTRMLLSPFLLVRPFPWEVHNPQSAIAALEGLFLLWLVFRRRKGLLQVMSSPLSSAFVAFILAYFVEFSLAYGAVTRNFGILVRERVMVLPCAVMLLCSVPRPVVQRILIRREPARAPARITPAGL